MTLAREGESSHQRRPVHHLSSCRALLRVAVLLGERQWVRLEVRPGRGWGVSGETRRGHEVLLSGPPVLLSGNSPGHMGAHGAVGAVG